MFDLSTLTQRYIKAEEKDIIRNNKKIKKKSQEGIGKIRGRIAVRA